MPPAADIFLPCAGVLWYNSSVSCNRGTGTTNGAEDRRFQRNGDGHEDDTIRFGRAGRAAGGGRAVRGVRREHLLLRAGLWGRPFVL